MSDDDLIRRGDAKAAFACETAYGRGVRAKLSDVPAASSNLVKREEIQRNRDEAYQTGWGDGYAEGYGKATSALPAAEAAQAREAALWEAWNVVWEAKTLLDAKNALHALIGDRT